MEIVLNFGAIFCALAFGLMLKLSKKKKSPKKIWNIAFKVLLQLSGVIAFLCTFFSMLHQKDFFDPTPPLWVIAIICIAPIALYATLAYQLENLYEEIMWVRKHGFKDCDKSFLGFCGVLLAIIITGNIAALYFPANVPTQLHFVLVFVLGAMICFLIGVVAAICTGIFALLFSFKDLLKSYWEWLTN